MAYAGFWKRVAAYLIDSVIIGIVVGIIGALFGVGLFSSMSSMESMNPEDQQATAGMMAGIMTTFYLILIAAQWLYFAFMESSAKQATLGKMALSIIVTDVNGNRISFGRATGRYFGKIVSAAILCIGYLMAAFTEKKQGLHDIIAGTLVVNKQ